MNRSLIVRGAPQEYECRIQSWESLPNHLLKRNLSNLYLIHGEESWENSKNSLPELVCSNIHYEYYRKECTDSRVTQIVTQLKAGTFDAVIAVGGGKVIDLGKAAAYRAQLPFIVLPTLAATCAAYTPLSVMYDENGSMLRFDIFPKSTDLVLLDPKVILYSPPELMIAGIGDTLAKWYEAQTLISQLSTLPIEVKVAFYAAQQCREILLTQSFDALDAMKSKKINQAFLDVVETNILLAGMVGGFGDEYGRTAGAHSIHDALTLIPASHRQLHGNKVAYGILVQLAIENNWEEIDCLLPFYQKLGLPYSLKAMGITLIDEEYRTVAVRACREDETIHFMKGKISPAVVVDAMKNLENYMRQN